MDNDEQEYQNPTNNTASVLIGMLIGGLAGAVTMLLVAPQSGKRTRRQIQQKGIELSDRTIEMVEDTMAQVRSSAKKFTAGGRKKIKEFKHHSQELVGKQLDRVSAVMDAGKTAISRTPEVDTGM